MSRLTPATVEQWLRQRPSLFAPYVPSWIMDLIRQLGTEWYLTPRVLAWCAKNPAQRVPMFTAVCELTEMSIRQARQSGQHYEPDAQNKRVEELLKTDPKPKLKRPLWSTKSRHRAARKALDRKDAAE